eukprot:scaffold127247_cov57-Phaeocystis_antarctica.AAC.3
MGCHRSSTTKRERERDKASGPAPLQTVVPPPPPPPPLASRLPRPPSPPLLPPPPPLLRCRYFGLATASPPPPSFAAFSASFSAFSSSFDVFQSTSAAVAVTSVATTPITIDPTARKTPGPIKTAAIVARPGLLGPVQFSWDLVAKRSSRAAVGRQAASAQFTPPMPEGCRPFIALIRLASAPPKGHITAPC